MEMQRCPKGHYYDPAKTPECPYCTPGNKTLPLDDLIKPQDHGIDPTVPVPPGPAPAVEDAEKTIGIPPLKIGIDPVVGWLVCVQGQNKGQDYRLHAGNNKLGRSEQMDVCIGGDRAVSRDSNALVSYDMQEKVFYFTPRDGREIARLNGKSVFNTVELKPYDRIQVGETHLLFIPFCGKEFDWM